MDAPGKGVLKVSSILFIVFGAITAICAAVLLILGAVLKTVEVPDYAVDNPSAVVGILFIVLSIVLVVIGLVEIVVGIIGIKKYADPAGATYFIITGSVLCGLNLLLMILTLNIFGFIGFILPILYVVGGFTNKKAISTPVA